MTEWIKDYKANELYRNSFFELAELVFGIRFKPWYEAGHWTADYIPYSCVEDGIVVANVSVNKMTFNIDGSCVKAIQVGTVMTHPNHRKKGLARQLLETVINEWESKVQFIFLAADADAMSLYQRCGFVGVPETKYEVDALVIPNGSVKAKRVQLSADEMLTRIRNYENKGGALYAKGDEHILMFYYGLGYDQNVYCIGEDTMVMISKRVDVLDVYGIWSQKDIDINEILSALPLEGIQKVAFQMTPPLPIRGLHTAIDWSGNWMVRSKSPHTFPEGFRYPRISQA